MACICPPKPPIPVLPSPFSIPQPPLPPLPTLAFCCQLPDIIPPIPPIPWPAPLDPATIAAINLALSQAKTAIDAYLDALPLDCPRAEAP